MTDNDYIKILTHGSLKMIGPATVEMLVSRGARRAGLARLISSLQHRMFDEGAADASMRVPAPEVQIYEQHHIIKH